MRPHVPTRLRMRLSGTRLARHYARAHALLYRLSGGRLGGRIRGSARGADPPLLLLSTTGRRSGTTRTTPLIFLRHGDELVVAAANAGHPDAPAWWRNLQADPRAIAQIGRRRSVVVATEVTGERRAALWARFLEVYAPLRDYQAAIARRIPLVVLRPDTGAAR